MKLLSCQLFIFPFHHLIGSDEISWEAQIESLNLQWWTVWKLPQSIYLGYEIKILFCSSLLLLYISSSQLCHIYMEYNLLSPVEEGTSIIKSLWQAMVQSCPKNSVKNPYSTLQVHLAINEQMSKKYKMRTVVLLIYYEEKKDLCIYKHCHEFLKTRLFVDRTQTQQSHSYTCSSMNSPAVGIDFHKSFLPLHKHLFLF